LDKLWEVRWLGRGGQGVVTAARLLAEAAHEHEHFPGVMAAPSFGAERRGAPVSASTRISERPVLLRSQVYQADLLVVFDHTVLSLMNVAEQLKKDAAVVINAPVASFLDESGVDLKQFVSVDASKIAMDAGMVSAAFPLVGAAMLGALIHALPSVKLSSILQCLQAHFPGKRGEQNVAMAKRGYEEATIKEFQ